MSPDPVRAALAATYRTAQAELTAEAEAAYHVGYERGWLAGWEARDRLDTTTDPEGPTT